MNFEKPAPSGIEDLVSRIKAESEPAQHPSTKLEREAVVPEIKDGQKTTENESENLDRISKKVEQILPQIEAFVELAIANKREYEGSMDYATLAKNIDLYLQTRRNEAQRSIDENILVRNIIQQIGDDRSAVLQLLKETISPDTFRALLNSINNTDLVSTRTNSNPDDAKRATVEFWSNSQGAREAAQSEMFHRMEYVDDGMVNRGKEFSFGTPENFIKLMSARYIENKSPEMATHFAAQRPDKRAFGFAIAALKANDAETGARALALANTVKELDTDSVRLLEDTLNTLSPNTRKKFADTFQQSRQHN